MRDHQQRRHGRQVEVALRTIQKIRKQLEDSDFDMKVTVVRKIQDRPGQNMMSNNFISNVRKLIHDPSISVH